jgi:hypothetical protein
VYCRLLAFPIAEPLLQAERFGKVPVKFLLACIESLEQNRQNVINAESISSAKLGMVVLGALGGKTVKAKLQDFLPFEPPRSEEGLSSATIEAMKWALKHETLPPAVVGMLGAELG